MMISADCRRNQTGLAFFDWGSRLSVAAAICDALAFMHHELHADGISHGNRKSSNILFDARMHPCISEYGLTAAATPRNPPPPSDAGADDSSHHPSADSAPDSSAGDGDRFAADVYGFGVVVLELLTAKVVDNSGFDLAGWVNSVVREERTAEVFDGALISGSASEERMVRLLQVALKCISPAAEARPGMGQVAAMVGSIRDEEEGYVATWDAGESK